MKLTYVGRPSTDAPKPFCIEGTLEGFPQALSLVLPRLPAPRSCLVEPDSFEAVEERGRVLAESFHAGLGEVDRIGREEPEVRHVLEDHELDAVVDLLALLLVHRASALLQQRVEVGHAPRVPGLALGRVQGAEE